MENQTTAQLAERLSAARHRFRLSSLYRHRKGSTYRIIGHLINSTTGEVDIRYRRVDGKDFDKWAEMGIEFCRPAAEWTPDRFERIAG